MGLLKLEPCFREDANSLVVRFPNKYERRGRTGEFDRLVQFNLIMRKLDELGVEDVFLQSTLPELAYRICLEGDFEDEIMSVQDHVNVAMAFTLGIEGWRSFAMKDVYPELGSGISSSTFMRVKEVVDFIILRDGRVDLNSYDLQRLQKMSDVSFDKFVKCCRILGFEVDYYENSDSGEGVYWLQIVADQYDELVNGIKAPERGSSNGHLELGFTSNESRQVAPWFEIFPGGTCRDL